MLCDATLTFSLPSMSTSLINQVQTVVDVIGTLEKHVERQQSENREAGASASVKEEDNNEELNVEESSSAGGDDLVQPSNNVTSDDGNGSPVLAATTIPTSEGAGGKKRSRDATSSTRNTRAQTRSKKRAKLPHSSLYETAEVAGTTSQTPVLRRSARRASTNPHEGTFEGTSRVIEAEEEADDDCMPIHEEDGSPLDNGDDDHGEDGKKIIVAKRAQQVRSAIKSFDERFKDLMDFKDKFGHCDVSRKHTGEYQSLGEWCNDLRKSYKKIQNGEQPRSKLTEENIRQLEDADFKWSLSTFDERYAELMKFKEKFGHCNVPQKNSGKYLSLGRWCNNVRVSYNKIQKGEIPYYKLMDENIRKLTDAGFQWSLDTRMTFDERYAELMAFKKKFGHCDVSRRESVEYQSLRGWCDKMRMAYKKIQKNERPHHTLTEDNIRQLENAGFKWRLRQSAYTS